MVCSFLRSCLGGLVLAGLTNALNPVEVSSQIFVDSGTGNRFQIIGIDYQPGGSAGFDPYSNMDPLTDPAACLRDAALMQHLGINTIRTYNLNPGGNHDECASIFNKCGIYMIIDVNSPLPGGSIAQLDPADSYNLAYLNRTFAVIEAFMNYPNVIGFFSGNEIINDFNTGTIDPPYIRAVTRDLKSYISSRSSRAIPVGYSAADFRPALVDTANYLQCTIASETGISSRSDFFALNSYSWCGNDTFDSSTYNVLAADFTNTTIPIFFSEYGCIVPPPRYFTEVPVLYGPLMTDWSGGLVYEWTETGNGYGLVSVNADGSVTLTEDFDNLQAQYASLNFTLIQSQNSTASELVAPECETSLIPDATLFSTDFDIPIAPDGTEQLISQGVEGITPGSIISVTATYAAVVVTLVNGATTSGLTITSVSSAQRPQSAITGQTGSKTSSSSSISSAPTATATPNAAAGGIGGRMNGFALLGCVAAMLWAW